MLSTLLLALVMLRYPCLDHTEPVRQPVVCAHVVIPREEIFLYAEERPAQPLTPPYTYVPFTLGYTCLPQNPDGTGPTVCDVTLSMDPDGTGSQPAVPDKFGHLVFCLHAEQDCSADLDFIGEATLACTPVAGAPSTGGCPTNMFPTVP